MPLENPKRSELTGIIPRCEFSSPMATSLFVFFVSLRSIVRSRVDLELENLALRHQIALLQRSVKKRPKLTPTDRISARAILPPLLLLALTSLKPDTISTKRQDAVHRALTNGAHLLRAIDGPSPSPGKGFAPHAKTSESGLELHGERLHGQRGNAKRNRVR